MIDNAIVLSDLVESSGYSSKTLQKGSCPYAPLDEVLQYGHTRHFFKFIYLLYFYFIIFLLGGGWVVQALYSIKLKILN